MSSSFATENMNKENDVVPHKPDQSNCLQRTFGTNLSKSVHSQNDPLKLDYYSSDILSYFLSTENTSKINSMYMKNQAEINEKMRAILIDWLIDVHFKFKLSDETLYLAVYIIDKYLEITPITKNRLQLVGVTAMLIASKYEDIYPPEASDLVNISDHAFNKEDVIEMEMNILKQIKYCVTVNSSFRFLQMFCKFSDNGQSNIAFARYFIELALVDYRMLRYSNSIRAASAIYLMHKFKEIKPEWGIELSARSKLIEDDLKACAKDMCLLFQQASKSSLQAVRNKFSSHLFYQVATTPYI